MVRAGLAGIGADTGARVGEDDVARLVGDAGIVRGRARIRATITSASAAIALRDDGGLSGLVWSFRPEQALAPRTVAEIPTRSDESVALAKALRAEGFAFVGPTTMFALMEAAGLVDTHVVGSHRRGIAGRDPV